MLGRARGERRLGAARARRPGRAAAGDRSRGWGASWSRSRSPAAASTAPSCCAPRAASSAGRRSSPWVGASRRSCSRSPSGSGGRGARAARLRCPRPPRCSSPSRALDRAFDLGLETLVLPVGGVGLRLHCRPRRPRLRGAGPTGGATGDPLQRAGLRSRWRGVDPRASPPAPRRPVPPPTPASRSSSSGGPGARSPRPCAGRAAPTSRSTSRRPARIRREGASLTFDPTGRGCGAGATSTR